ncbi:MAG: zinc ABC transporter substrate-binding protein [Candidatus Schekmanbacteria bacterium]|nr:zinc ABC transporter substrate-binding protein [Candidatus Schekmanbacteria bacterium]
MKKIFIPTIVIVVLLIIISYIKTNTRPPGKELRIAAGFYPLAEFAGQIAADKMEVVNITPTGVEPHDFEPTPRHITLIYSAGIFIYNGGGLDPWADKLKPSLEKRGIIVINMLDQIKNLSGNDPHIWLDPVLAAQEVEIIRDAMLKADPVNGQTYIKNAEQYLRKLTELDKKYQDHLSACTLREAITSHAAFGYLAKRYGISLTPIAISPEEEPSAKKMAQLALAARQKNIKYIFFETLASPRLAETIAAEIGAKTLVFNPLEGLTAEEKQAGKNYISIMEENLENLRTALQCP